MASGADESTVQTVAEFEERIRGMSLDDFAAAFPHPFLVEWRPKESNEPFRGSRTATPGSSLPRGADPSNARVVQVRKTAGGAAFRHITIGRTPNNDVPLGDSCISKMHAYLVEPESGSDDTRWRLVDVSTFGTSVNGEECKTDQPVPLLNARTEASAPRISFADIHFIFLEHPASVLATIAGMLQRGE